MFRDAAKRETVHPTAAVGSHDDEVRFRTFDRVQDRERGGPRTSMAFARGKRSRTRTSVTSSRAFAASSIPDQTFDER